MGGTGSVPPKGYALNRPLDSNANGNTATGTYDGIIRKDPTYQNVTSNSPDFDGVVLQDIKGRQLILASNAETPETMVDVAMFQSTRHLLNEGAVYRGSFKVAGKVAPGIAIQDYLPNFDALLARDRYDNSPLIDSLKRAKSHYTQFIIFDQKTLASSKMCESSFLVCADKLTVYNSLGPSLNVVGFTLLTPPADHSPYR